MNHRSNSAVSEMTRDVNERLGLIRLIVEWRNAYSLNGLMDARPGTSPTAHAIKPHLNFEVM